MYVHQLFLAMLSVISVSITSYCDCIVNTVQFSNHSCIFYKATCTAMTKQIPHNKKTIEHVESVITLSCEHYRGHPYCCIALLAEHALVSLHALGNKLFTLIKDANAILNSLKVCSQNTTLRIMSYIIFNLPGLWVHLIVADGHVYQLVHMTPGTGMQSRCGRLQFPPSLYVIHENRRLKLLYIYRNSAYNSM